MDFEDCSRVGCGGGSLSGGFTLIMFFLWIYISAGILFSDPVSFSKYAKNVPVRILLFAVWSAISFCVLWLGLKIILWLGFPL
jgi:hypothetical protein